MAFYNNSVHTHEIDPIYYQVNSKAEFSLPSNTNLLPNMRLGNIGVTASDDVASYNFFCGSDALIQSIGLYDGNQLLDQCLSANIWSCFKNYNRDNNVNASKYRSLNGSGRGLKIQGKYIPGTPDFPLMEIFIDQPKVNTTSSTTKLGYLTLQQLLPFLSKSLYVPTTVYKNLRLVINFETDQVNVLTLSNKGPQTIRPVLFCDELIDDVVNNLGSYKGVQWDAVEHDVVVLPAITTIGSDGIVTTADQSITFNPHGFKNKTLKRLLMVNTPTSSEVYQSAANTNRYGGKLTSRTQYKQRVQFVVNGRALIVGNGITGANERLGYLHDTFGKCSSFPGCNQVGANNTHFDSVLDYVGSQDYLGVTINEYIGDLQIEYQRTGIYSGADDMATNKLRLFNESLVIHLFGEVAKSVVVNSDGSYRVMYV